MKTPDRTLLAAVAAGLASAALLQIYMERLELQVSGGRPVQILMLTADLAEGEPLTRANLGTQQLPSDYLESRHVLAKEIDQVIDARLAVAGRANESLLWTDLADMRRAGRQLADLVPHGMRALTIKAEQGTFAQLLRPGDRVDVLHTPSGTDRSGTRAAVENVLVLAVGADHGQKQAGRTTSRGTGVTLAVSQQDAATIIDARRDGSLHLSLRGPEDTLTSDSLAKASSALSRP